MPKLKLVKSDVLDDWYLIQRAEHDGREWTEKTGPNTYSFRCSARLGIADTEGHYHEMKAIAHAIRNRENVSFKRCACHYIPETDTFYFFSPRNSIDYFVDEDEDNFYDGLVEVSTEHADDLAEQILAIPVDKPSKQ